MALQLRERSIKTRLVFGVSAALLLSFLSFLGIRYGEVSHALDAPDTTGPAAPVIQTPADGHYFAASPIKNSWSAVNDPSGIADYEIEYIYDDGHTFSGGPTRLVSGNQTWRNHQPSGNEQGGVTIRVRAIDGAGNKGDYSAPVHYYYDAAAPTIDLQEPQNGDVIGRGEQFTVKAHLTDNIGLANYRLQIDGIEPSHPDVADQPQTMAMTAGVSLDIHAIFNANDFTNGEHTITAWVTDKAGNESPRLIRTITIDKTAPTVTFTSPSQGSLVHDLITGVNFHDDSGLSQYGFDVTGPGVDFSTRNYKTTEKDISLDGFDLCAAAYYGNDKCPAELASGVYTVRAKAYDKYGNREISTTWQITVDRDSPAVTVTSPSERQVVGGQTLELQGSVADPSGIGEYRYQLLDANKDNTLGNSIIGGYTTVDDGVLGTLDISSLASGNYFVRVWATDGLGNKSSPVYVGFVVDHTPPQVTMQLTSSAAPSASTPVALSGHVSEPATIKLLLNGEELTDLLPITVDGQGNWQVRIDEGLARGVYTLTAQATDPYGNVGSTDPIGVTVGALVTNERISSGLTANLDDPFVVPRIFGALTPPALDKEAADDTGVLGVETQEGSAAEAVKDTAVAATEAGWKLFGVMWYWWAVGGATLGGMTWTAMALARRQMAEDAL